VGGGGNVGITRPKQKKKMALKGKLLRFSTTQSMGVDELLNNQNDIEIETKDVMSKKVDKNIGLKVNSNVLLDGDQIEKLSFSQDVDNL
jgi:hypothetical protein